MTNNKDALRQRIEELDKKAPQQWLWECNACRHRWLLADDAHSEQCPSCGSIRTEAADDGDMS